MLGSQLEMSEVRRPRVWGGCGGRKVTDGGAPDPAEVLRELSRGGGDPAEVLRELPQGGGGLGRAGSWCKERRWPRCAQGLGECTVPPAWQRRCGPGLRLRTHRLTRSSQFKNFSLGRDVISVLRTFCPGWRLPWEGQARPGRP